MTKWTPKGIRNRGNKTGSEINESESILCIKQHILKEQRLLKELRLLKEQSLLKKHTLNSTTFQAKDLHLFQRLLGIRRGYLSTPLWTQLHFGARTCIYFKHYPLLLFLPFDTSLLKQPRILKQPNLLLNSTSFTFVPKYCYLPSCLKQIEET